MIKTYLLVGMLCIPTIECFNFIEPTPKQYMRLQNCLADGKKLGDDMYARMTALNIPIRLKVWCQKIEQHGEYS
jgi:hypothetical protein|tara:strand:+ start:2567 stop:2788 length:222 start_codon:yes stop_codon:yes gene_type:complete